MNRSSITDKGMLDTISLCLANPKALDIGQLNFVRENSQLFTQEELASFDSVEMDQEAQEVPTDGTTIEINGVVINLEPSTKEPEAPKNEDKELTDEEVISKLEYLKVPFSPDEKPKKLRKKLQAQLHVVTEQDLLDNPGMADQGMVVGDSFYMDYEEPKE